MERNAQTINLQLRYRDVEDLDDLPRVVMYKPSKKFVLLKAVFSNGRCKVAFDLDGESIERNISFDDVAELAIGGGHNPYKKKDEAFTIQLTTAHLSVREANQIDIPWKNHRKIAVTLHLNQEPVTCLELQSFSSYSQVES